MLTTRDPGSTGRNTLANAAIGAVAGAVGVWVMDRVDWFMWSREAPETRRRTTAARPSGEPPAHVIATKLEKLTGADFQEAAEVPSLIEDLDTKRLAENRHHVVGTTVHYGIGVGPAIAYSLIQESLPLPGAARGAIYGLSLFLTQDEVANALTGLSSKPTQYPWQDHARGLVAHLVYGVVTDAVITLARRQFVGSTTSSNPQYAATGVAFI